jgi:hypothetical protein
MRIPDTVHDTTSRPVISSGLSDRGRECVDEVNPWNPPAWRIRVRCLRRKPKPRVVSLDVQMHGFDDLMSVPRASIAPRTGMFQLGAGTAGPVPTFCRDGRNVEPLKTISRPVTSMFMGAIRWGAWSHYALIPIGRLFGDRVFMIKPCQILG